MNRKGSPEPKFETDDERNYFLAVLPVHQDKKTRGEAKGEVRGEADKKGLNDTEKSILKYLEQGPISAEELANVLGLKSRSGFFTRTLKSLIKHGFIEYEYPETPRHPDQKYELKKS
jgi:ATP-dependent DNA helicase RecG